MSMKRFILAAMALMLVAVGVAQAVVINGIDGTGQNKGVVVGFPMMSITDSITAFAGGGQTSAVLLTSAVNRVTVVGTANDSVKLPPCRTGAPTGVGGGYPSKSLGLMMYVINADAADSMNVFPSTGDAINALSANAAYAVAANKTVGFICATGTTTGTWYSLLGG